MSLFEIVDRIDQLIRECHEVQKELDAGLMTLTRPERNVLISKIVSLEFEASKDVLNIAKEG